MTQTQGHYNKEIEKRIKESFLSLEILEAYSKGVGFPLSVKLIEDAEESFYGKFETDREFAEAFFFDFLDDKDILDKWPFNCIDWDDAASELMHDYFKVENFYFRHL